MQSPENRRSFLWARSAHPAPKGTPRFPHLGAQSPGSRQTSFDGQSAVPDAPANTAGHSPHPDTAPTAPRPAQPPAQSIPCSIPSPKRNRCNRRYSHSSVFSGRQANAPVGRPRGRSYSRRKRSEPDTAPTASRPARCVLGCPPRS